MDKHLEKQKRRLLAFQLGNDINPALPLLALLKAFNPASAFNPFLSVSKSSFVKVQSSLECYFPEKGLRTLHCTAVLAAVARAVGDRSDQLSFAFPWRFPSAMMCPGVGRGTKEHSHRRSDSRRHGCRFGEGEADKNDNDFAFQLERAARRRNIKFFNSLISKCAKKGDLDGVRAVFATMVDVGIEPNTFSHVGMINALGNAGEADMALAYMEREHVEGVEACTAVISGFAAELQLDSALKLLARMETGELAPPNVRTYSQVLRCCVWCSAASIADDVAATAVACADAAAAASPGGRGSIQNLHLHALVLGGKVDEAVALLETMDAAAVSVRLRPLLLLATEAALAGKVAIASTVLKRAQHAAAALPSRDDHGSDKHISADELAAAELPELAHAVEACLGSKRDLQARRTPCWHNVGEGLRASIPSSSGSDSGERELRRRLHRGPGKDGFLELGAGSGKTALAAACAEASQDIFAVEVRGDRCHEAAQRAALVMPAPPNLLLIHGDAAMACRAIQAGGAGKVVARFPQPWPCFLLEPTTRAAIAHVLAPGGRLHVITDDAILVRKLNQFYTEKGSQFQIRHQDGHDSLMEMAGEPKGTENTSTFFEHLWANRGRAEQYSLEFCKYENCSHAMGLGRTVGNSKMKKMDTMLHTQNSGVPDVISFRDAVLECQKDGRWERALSLIDEMNEVFETPDLRSFSAAISACRKGEQWEQALPLLDTAHNLGLTLNVAISDLLVH